MPGVTVWERPWWLSHSSFFVSRTSLYQAVLLCCPWIKCQKNQRPEPVSGSRLASPFPSIISSAILPVQLHCKGADLLSLVQRNNLALSLDFYCIHMYVYVCACIFCPSVLVFIFVFAEAVQCLLFSALVTGNKKYSFAFPKSHSPQNCWQHENWHRI